MQNKLFAFLSAIFLFTILNPTLAFAQSDSLPSIKEEIRWLQAESIIFSVSRYEQKVSDTAAASFVITQEDIRRSGATTIPEILRMVPGLQVARIDANTWAVSSRGFNGRLSDKLLVLIDGRTVYHPILPATLWRNRDVMFENIERIEVIRGPGASMWGANAVNGIINIITKSAEDTQGGLIAGGGGNIEKGFGSLRFGGKIKEKVFYRGYIKVFDRDNLVTPDGDNAKDDWDALRTGFKLDGKLDDRNLFTLQGDYYTGDYNRRENQFAPVSPFFDNGGKIDKDFSGGNILWRWNHTFSDTSDSSLKIYYDRVVDKFDYSFSNDRFKTTVDTFDFDFQHRFSLGERHDFVWGLGFRYITDDIQNSLSVSFDPKRRGREKYSAFVQDEISIVHDKLKFIVGSKFSKNDYSDYEIQPNARILWHPREKQTVWASVSRAVRIPSRVEHDISNLFIGLIPGSVPGTGFFTAQGDNGFDSETVIAYELGYRTQPNDNIFLDIAAFYNDYDKLATGRMGTPFLDTSFPTPFLSVPFFTDNEMTGETFGIEVSARLQVLEWWRLQPAYSYIKMNLHPRSGATLPNPDAAEGQTPRNQFSLNSSFDLPKDVEFDVFFRYVDNLPTLNIDSYVEANIRLGWKPTEDLEISFVARNLLDKRHAEFQDSGPVGSGIITEMERSYYAQFVWKFW